MDESYDRIVVGSGGGSLCSALIMGASIGAFFDFGYIAAGHADNLAA